jgi:hypothetical protein
MSHYYFVVGHHGALFEHGAQFEHRALFAGIRYIHIYPVETEKMKYPGHISTIEIFMARSRLFQINLAEYSTIYEI